MLRSTDRYAPTDVNPESGQIIGVAIRYRWTVDVDGEPTTVESMTALRMGTADAHSFERQPDGLITHEEVFHLPASLIGAGFAT